MDALTLDRSTVLDRVDGNDRHDRRRFRGPGQLTQPLPAAMRWADLLPSEVQPRALLRYFPRIANSLARSWADRFASATYLDDLVTDRRGNRQGFPPAIQHELLRLQDYLEGRFPGVVQRR